jgi:meso-butanediol dehydrogenase/(S,S)-butanediol dehydrogenase/diacetyl reductase
MKKGALDRRVALVTGGGRGIGRAVALALAEEGADVAVAARSTAELDQVCGEIDNLGRRACAATYDAMDGPGTKSMVDDVTRQLGRLDILFNVAGGIVGDIDQLLTLSHDDRLFEDNLFLNLTSAYYATRAALPHMVTQDYGRVIFTGSGYAKTGGGAIAYSAAKHGLIGLMRAMVHQVPPAITVNTLCPGWTETRLANDYFENAALAMGTEPASLRAAAEAENIQKRLVQPEELGPMAVLIASEVGGRAITGQVISVDGGYKV